MSKMILAIVTVVVAVILGILALALPQENMGIVIIIVRFFEVMLPILAVGALLKYIFCSKEK